MPSPLTSALADAITKQEGFFPGSASYVNNNPGNIMDLAYYKQTGQFKLATFPTLEAGRAALESLVDKYVSAGHTLNSFFAKYAPAGHGDNSPSTYASNVAGWLGIPTDVPLAQVQLAPANPAPSDGSGATGGPEGVQSGDTLAGFAYTPLLIALGAVGAVWWWWKD